MAVAEGSRRRSSKGTVVVVVVIVRQVAAQSWSTPVTGTATGHWYGGDDRYRTVHASYHRYLSLTCLSLIPRTSLIPQAEGGRKWNHNNGQGKAAGPYTSYHGRETVIRPPSDLACLHSGPPAHRRYLPFAGRPSCFEVLRIPAASTAQTLIVPPHHLTTLPLTTTTTLPPLPPPYHLTTYTSSASSTSHLTTIHTSSHTGPYPPTTDPIPIHTHTHGR